MNVMVPIPDEFAARFGSETELGRRALEALALEEFRAGRLTKDELRDALGFEVLNEVDGFLKSRGVFEEHTLADLDREVRVLERLGF